MEKRIIWTSVFDLSKEGVREFCKSAASIYGKTENELLNLSLMNLAVPYMWNERSRKKQEVMKKLSVSSETPILVIGDVADFGGSSHIECSVLSGESLAKIFSVPTGLCTTFFSDGKDVRCETITDDGMNHYLFRLVERLDGFGKFVADVESGAPFTESELTRYTKSLLPSVEKILDWDIKPGLDEQISSAEKRQESSSKREVVSELFID